MAIRRTIVLFALFFAVPVVAATHRRAIAPPAKQPSSFDLINQAESSRAIDSETALLYRVYSIFGDDRLPQQFRGGPSQISDGLFMAEVRQKLPTLSPAAQAALQPFFIPPAYKGSWADKSRSDEVRASDTPPPCREINRSVWSFHDAEGAPVRIWYQIEGGLGDESDAFLLAQYVTSPIWPALTGLMNRPGTTTGLPISDATQNCNGGDGKLDVYLIGYTRFNEDQGLTFPYASTNGPAWILLGRPFTRGSLTHEIFHAFQFSYPVKAYGTGDDDWWWEASATWAEDFVDKGLQDEQRFAGDYLETPYRALASTLGNHEYGAYLLPFFVTRKYGSADFVRATWEKMSGQTAIEALDASMPDRFEKIWPDFAKANWNRTPFTDYQTWDGLEAKASNVYEVPDSGDARLEIDYDLPPLSAQYEKFTFADEDSSVAFFNGVTTKLAVRDITGGALGLQYVNDAADPADTKGAHITALIRMKGAWTEEDWTNRPYVKYCRDEVAERIDEIILIISNSEFADSNRHLKPPGLAPVMVVSNFGCWKWKGTADLTSISGLSVHADVTWNRIAQSTLPMQYTFAAEGTAKWNFNVEGCKSEGSIAVGSENAMNTYNFAPKENPLNRTYLATGVTALVALCAGKGPGLPWISTPPASTNTSVQFPKASGSGKTLDGTYSIPGGAGQWVWHFEAQRQ